MEPQYIYIFVLFIKTKVPKQPENNERMLVLDTWIVKECWY